MDKKKSSRKRKTKASTQSEAELAASVDREEEALPLSKIEKINIEQVFAQALDRYKNELIDRKKDSCKELNHLSSIVEEYLSCFALIGFSLEGDKVCIFNANNARDEGALVDHLRSTFIEIASNRP